MKKLIIILLMVVSIPSVAQISGTINDENDNPLDLVTISLLSAADSLFIASEYTDEQGEFIFMNSPSGQYLIEANRIGYSDFMEEVDLTSSSSADLGVVKLVANTTSLEMAEVSAAVPFIKRQIDRVVVNPNALIANAGSSAIEVLERTPGVSVDDNGNVLLKGRSGVAIFINDKPSYLSGTELETYLRSLPSGSIKSIEIMENPPAKYEAAGNSGVINIILARNTLKGFYGSLSTSYRQGITNGSNNSLNLNFNRKKLSVSANVSGGFYNSFQDLNINRYTILEEVQTGAFNQSTYNKRHGEYLKGKLGLDYYLTDVTTLGVSAKVSTSPSEADDDNTSLVSSGTGVLQQRVEADNLTETKFENELYNVYLVHKLDTLGSEISIDGDYVAYDSDRAQTFKNQVFTPGDLLTYEDQINGEIPSDIEIWAARIDYTKPFKNGSKLEAGAKYSDTQTDNEAIYSTTIDEVTTPNYGLSNRFIYDEQISAAYLNYRRSLGKLTVQAGLRAEQTNLKGNQLGNIEQPDTSFTRDYASLFPTFYSALPLDSLGNNTLTFSYGRRIDRPYYQDLNPFVSPLDRFTFYSGNPNLLATYSHNLSLTYSYKGKFNTTASYSKTVDGINETLEIREGIYYSRPGNISSNQSMSLAMDANLRTKKVYNFNGYVELGHLIFDSPLYTQQLKSSGSYIYAQATNSFELGKGWKASLSGRYRSDIVSAQLLVKSFWVSSIGVQKRVLNGKGVMRANLSDMFYSRRGDGIINNLEDTDADWNSIFDSRSLRVAFSYNFGSASGKEKHESRGSDEEQNRVKG